MTPDELVLIADRVVQVDSPGVYSVRITLTERDRLIAALRESRTHISTLIEVLADALPLVREFDTRDISGRTAWLTRAFAALAEAGSPQPQPAFTEDELIGMAMDADLPASLYPQQRAET